MILPFPRAASPQFKHELQFLQMQMGVSTIQALTQDEKN